MTRARAAQRGLTLIELLVALAIVAALFGSVAMGVGALTGTKARTAAGELAGVMRSLYDSAALSGKTCRLVFELSDPKDDDGETRYHAECAAGGVTTSRDREAALREGNRAAEAQARDGDGRRDWRQGTSGEPTLTELLGQEKTRVEEAEKFSGFTAEELAPRTLPGGVSLSVWTRHQHKPVEAGLAYVYFFPQGFAEKAQVQVRQGDNVWTLVLSPLTGKVTVVGEALEVPRS